MMRESSQLEFKESISNSFLKTVSTFANYGGEVILFGVDDAGQTAGMEQAKQACLDIEKRTNDTISPNPDYSLQVDRHTNTITLSMFLHSFRQQVIVTCCYALACVACVHI